MADAQGDAGWWAAVIARAAAPFADCEAVPDGEFVRLQKADGEAISVRHSLWPEVARLIGHSPTENGNAV